MTATLVRKLTAGLALAVAIVGGSSSALAQKKGDGSQAITIDPTGSVGTFPQQGLNSGTVVGYYLDTGGMAHGFIRSVDGNYTIIDVPGAAGTQAYGINDKGTVVGWWFEEPTAKGSVYHGYLRAKDGKFTSFELPSDVGPFLPQSPSPLVVIQLPLSINRGGTVTGSYVDTNNASHGFVLSPDAIIPTKFDPTGSVGTLGDTNGINRQGTIAGGYTTVDGVIHGFVRDAEGTITSFDGPGAGTTNGNGSVGEMITDAGTIPGVSLDNNGVNHAFIRYSDGSYVTFGVTGAGTAQGQGTLATAANVAGLTAGSYIDASGVFHGFVRSRHGKITTFDVPGQGTAKGQGVTAVNSINEEGEVVGWYVDSSGATHGFIYQYGSEDDLSSGQFPQSEDPTSSAPSTANETEVAASRIERGFENDPALAAWSNQASQVSCPVNVCGRYRSCGQRCDNNNGLLRCYDLKLHRPCLSYRLP